LKPPGHLTATHRQKVGRPMVSSITSHTDPDVFKQVILLRKGQACSRICQTDDKPPKRQKLF
jgi:hypothetical protein